MCYYNTSINTLSEKLYFSHSCLTKNTSFSPKLNGTRGTHDTLFISKYKPYNTKPIIYLTHSCLINDKKNNVVKKFCTPHKSHISQKHIQVPRKHRSRYLLLLSSKNQIYKPKQSMKSQKSQQEKREPMLLPSRLTPQ